MKTRNRIIAALAGLALAGSCGLILVTAAMFAGIDEHGASAACGNPAPVDPAPTQNSPMASPAAGADLRQRYNATQLANAAVIVDEGRNLAVPTRGWVIAVATAIQESQLINSSVATDHDSVGLFQQRPSQGWGTVAQLTDPHYASRAFYRKLVKVPGWQTMPLTDAAQAVQRSEFPNAYAKWEPDARAITAQVLGVSSVDDIGGGPPGAPCGTGPLDADVVIAPSGWTAPVHGVLGSGFRPPDRPGHDGVDLIAARFTPIHAAAAGTVILVTCNSSIGTCDRDGGTDVLGCGWYVEILHAQNVVSRYCHMVRRPQVTVGQVVPAGTTLGFVGSSGNSSGPHLHFEIHTGRPATDGNATNPVPFLADRGIDLAHPAAGA